VKVKFIFAWYDLWVGVFVDRPKRRIYVFPVPCLGVVVSWGRPRRAAGDPETEGADRG